MRHAMNHHFGKKTFCYLRLLLRCQCETRLGDFWKFLATKFVTKVVQIIGNNLLGLFIKNWLLCKNCCGYLWVNLETFGPLFTPTSGHTVHCSSFENVFHGNNSSRSSRNGRARSGSRRSRTENEFNDTLLTLAQTNVLGSTKLLLNSFQIRLAEKYSMELFRIRRRRWTTGSAQ